MTTVRSTGHSPETAPALSRAEAESFLYREARLLDSLRLEEWLTLFTEDGVYWLPIDDDDQGDGADSISILCDDTARREERVFRTLHTPVLDQNPRSRTMHLTGNVEVEEPDASGDVLVRCNQVITELRSGGRLQVGLNQQRSFSARGEYLLRHTSQGWRIRLKKLILIDADQPLYNLTFVL